MGELTWKDLARGNFYLVRFARTVYAAFLFGPYKYYLFSPNENGKREGIFIVHEGSICEGLGQGEVYENLDSDGGMEILEEVKVPGSLLFAAKDLLNAKKRFFKEYEEFNRKNNSSK